MSRLPFRVYVDILFSRELLPIPTFSRFPFNFCQQTGEGWTGDSNPHLFSKGLLDSLGFLSVRLHSIGFLLKSNDSIGILLAWQTVSEPAPGEWWEWLLLFSCPKSTRPFFMDLGPLWVPLFVQCLPFHCILFHGVTSRYKIFCKPAYTLNRSSKTMGFLYFLKAMTNSF